MWHKIHTFQVSSPSTFSLFLPEGQLFLFGCLSPADISFLVLAYPEPTIFDEIFLEDFHSKGMHQDGRMYD